MIVSILPINEQNIYGMMVKKELSLRNKNQGTLHRKGRKKKDQDTWVHNRYNGSIKFQKSLGGVVIAKVEARNPEDEWQLLSSFIGFLDRYFRHAISNISITYDAKS